jgi:hypothetical protein
MNRASRLAIAVSTVFALAVSAFAAGSPAKTAASPFYLLPAATKECQNVTHCKGVPGPWVYIPANGEATFLFGCPERRSFVVGGSDARASSTDVLVTYDGQLGAPIGEPKISAKNGAVLLFHATTVNGKPGSFQPILGCVSLTDLSKRSTVSARLATSVPGTNPGAPLDLRSTEVELQLATGLRRPTIDLACSKREKLVGSWSAIAFSTASPPDPAYGKAVTIKTTRTGRTVHAAFSLSRQFGILAPQTYAQVGAMCEPT